MSSPSGKTTVVTGAGSGVGQKTRTWDNKEMRATTSFACML
jgi:NADP-dependent 3-hydroxy acid dehydrogenase YdfG